MVPIYVVTYAHPDEAGWQQHLMPHVQWLRDRLDDGTLIASGPFHEDGPKSAMLLLAAESLTALEDLVATDPFAQEGLIDNMTVRLWDPIFGIFNERSSMPNSG